MGDRGNICMKEESGNEIYFYSHWTGNSLFDVLKEALMRGRGRWSDEAYLARIIFCEMVKHDLMDTTGFGISTYVQDNEYPIFYVNSENQKVSVGSREWSFEEFVQLEADPRIK